MASSFITILDPPKHEQLKEALIEQGFLLSPLAYAKFRASREGISCTLYESGKLVVQGKKSPEWIDYFLEPQILERIERATRSSWYENFATHMGSDETGKGDLFGPLCVACVLVESDQLQILHELGVQDSKNIPDPRIRDMALGIWKLCPCEVQVLQPASYNKLWSRFKNLNRLMAWVHASLIEKLYQRERARMPQFALVDQFSPHSGIGERLISAGVDLPLQERVRAESDPAVAAASILARAAFLKGLQQCGEKAGRILPKGSGAPAKQALREIMRDSPHFDISEVTKVHFKTVAQVREELG